MPKSTTCSRHNYPLTWSDTASLARRVRCHASTHDGTGFLVFHAVGKLGGIPSVGHNVLLKGSRDRHPRILLVRAVQLVGAVRAEFAVTAGAPNPLYARAITDFPLFIHVVAYCNHHASTFVASDALGFGRHLDTKGSPAIVDQGFIRSTKTGPVL